MLCPTYIYDKKKKTNQLMLFNSNLNTGVAMQKEIIFKMLSVNIM